MTTPERNTDQLHEVQRLLKTARPDQIKRLMRDILETASNEDFNHTGTA